MEVTGDSYNLLGKLMLLHLQILFNCAIAKAVLMRASAEQTPSLHRIAPMYLKLVTSSSFWWLMFIFALLLFLLFFMTLLFAVLTSITYTLALCTSLLMGFKLTFAAANNVNAVGES